MLRKRVGAKTVKQRERERKEERDRREIDR